MLLGFSIFEWIVVVTGIATVWLTVRQHILNWPIGIASSAALFVVALQNKLYSDGGLQVVYIVLGFYGWWHWLYGNPAKRDALPVTRTRRSETAIIVVVASVFFVVLGLGLDQWTDTDVPYYDAFPTTASLVAQYLLTRKYLANWPVWIFMVNVPYIALYLYKGLYLLAALQPVFIGLSIAGWVQWRHSMLATEGERDGDDAGVVIS